MQIVATSARMNAVLPVRAMLSTVCMYVPAFVYMHNRWCFVSVYAAAKSGGAVDQEDVRAAECPGAAGCWEEPGWSWSHV